MNLLTLKMRLNQELLSLLENFANEPDTVLSDEALDDPILVAAAAEAAATVFFVYQMAYDTAAENCEQEHQAQ